MIVNHGCIPCLLHGTPLFNRSPAGSQLTTEKMSLLVPVVDGNETSPSTQDEDNVFPTTPQEDHKAKRHAIRKAFHENMKNRPVKHDAAHVLLLSWDKKLDDMGVHSEVGQCSLDKA
jgi:hypothetical protein